MRWISWISWRIAALGSAGAFFAPGAALAQASPAAPVAPLQAEAAPAPPAPRAPFRPCGRIARAAASISPCTLAGPAPRIEVRLERNLTSAPAALVLMWREREDLGAMMYRLGARNGGLVGDGPPVTGSVYSVAVPISYCRPGTRRYDVELELADGRNVGLIGRVLYPCR